MSLWHDITLVARVRALDPQRVSRLLKLELHVVQAKFLLLIALNLLLSVARRRQATPARLKQVGLALFWLLLLRLAQHEACLVRAPTLASYNARRCRVFSLAGLVLALRDQFHMAAEFLVHERHIRNALRPNQVWLAIIPFHEDTIVSCYGIETLQLALTCR